MYHWFVWDNPKHSYKNAAVSGMTGNGCFYERKVRDNHFTTPMPRIVKSELALSMARDTSSVPEVSWI